MQIVTGVVSLFLGMAMFSPNAVLAGDLIVHSGGRLIVHSNITLTAGSLTIEPGGSVDIDLGSQIAATNFVFGGTVTVAEADADLSGGSSWQLFVGSVHGGSFDEVNLPALPGGLSWDQSTLTTAGTLSIGTATPPGISAITRDGDNYTVTGSSGHSGAGYSIVKSIDVALPVAQWVEVGTGTMGSAGEFSIKFPVTPGEPQAFYLIRIP